MDLKEYITEYVVSGKSSYRRFPSEPTFDNLVGWLKEMGYEELTGPDTKEGGHTSNILKEKRKGYYEFYLSRPEDNCRVLCVDNGCGEMEYRLFTSEATKGRPRISKLAYRNGMIDWKSGSGRSTDSEIKEFIEFVKVGTKIVEHVISHGRKQQDEYDWGGLSWLWDMDDFKLILGEAGYTEVKYTEERFLRMFSGKRKEFATEESIRYYDFLNGMDAMFISNRNNKQVFCLGFSPNTGRLSTITVYDNGIYYKNKDIEDLRKYLMMQG